MQTNILSAKKVKLHGMRSTKWDTKDKITQYKGLVNLYARDKKILDNDIILAKRQFKKEIRKIRKDIKDKRIELGDVIEGDRQLLRNTLSEHRDLQLAYQNMHAKKVIEVLHQDNFNKSKELNRINFTMKQRTEELIKLKLEYAELEDRITYESEGSQIPVEEQGQIITAQLQAAILKNEAACDIRYTYTNILNILQKDSIYFDAVLAALHIDGFNQGKCILKVTEMGQLSTEYLDDKKDQYRILEKALKKSMIERDQSLQEIQEELNFLNNNVKYLIRKDSIIELDEMRKSRHTYSESQLISSIGNIEQILNSLKMTTVVAKIEDIFPRMDDQIRQMERLQELVRKNAEDRDTLVNKSRHVEQMYNVLCHTMVETTFWYKEEKLRLNEEIAEVVTSRETTWETIKRRGELHVRIRTCLQHIAETLRNVHITASQQPTKETKAKETKGKDGKKKKEVKLADAKTGLSDGEDSTKLITLITQKLQVLVNAASTVELDDMRKEFAVNLFQRFVDNMTEKSHIFDTGIKEESLIAGLELEDPQVPSRAEIKARSAEICEKNAKTEFDVPILTIKKF